MHIAKLNCLSCTQFLLDMQSQREISSNIDDVVLMTLPIPSSPTSHQVPEQTQFLDKNKTVAHVYGKIAQIERSVFSQTGHVLELKHVWRSIDTAIGASSAQNIFQLVKNLMMFAKNLSGIDNQARKVLVVEVVKVILMEKYSEDSPQYQSLVELLPNLIDTFCQIAKAAKTIFKHSQNTIGSCCS